MKFCIENVTAIKPATKYAYRQKENCRGITVLHVIVDYTSLWLLDFLYMILIQSSQNNGMVTYILFS